MEIIDISMNIKKGMVIYPGDPKPEIKKYFSIPKDKVNLSLIKVGSHTGTHVDSELHIKEDGKSLGDWPLEKFYGECKVLDLTNMGKEIGKKELLNFEIKKGEIILLKTENSNKSSEEFKKDFAYLNEEASEYLVRKEIKAIGVDCLSVSKFNSEDKVHEILLKNLVIFEGLNLKKVEPGKYIFIGFPLKINCNGAPVRAVLIKNAKTKKI